MTKLFVRSDRDFRNSMRPLVLLLHGALRTSVNLQSWVPVLADKFDVALPDLPGHGETPAFGAPTLQAVAASVANVLQANAGRREVVVIGESIGGLIALGLADGSMPCVKGVIAADPPLTTSKQWTVRANLLSPTIAATPYALTLYEDAFGLSGERVARERIYYSLISKCRVPTLLLTGEVSLFPVRTVLHQQPCLIDAVDLAVIRALNNPSLSVEVIPGAGHLCLDPRIEASRRSVVKFLEGALSL